MKRTANRRLRRVITTAGFTFRDLADETNASIKTVERWVYEGRTPRRERAEAVARLLGVEAFWLWPGTNENCHSDAARGSYRLYPCASALPPAFFRQVMLSATRDLFILTGNEWLLAQLSVPQLAKYKARAKGHPSARILIPPSFVPMYSPGLLNADVRRHHSVKGTSVIRADDTMIIIPGDAGLAGPFSPVLLLFRGADDDVFGFYARGFETLWTMATAS